jgi:serine protease Do
MMTRELMPTMFATVLAVFISSAVARGEDLECRWFIPAIGRTLPVRCDETRTERVILGLTLAPLDQSPQAAQGAKGVVVIDVIADSEAAGRGIVRGDVILRTTAGLIATPDDVVQNIEMAEKQGLNTIGLFVDRQGATEFVSLRLS